MASKELIIDDSNYKQFLSDEEYDGHRGYGLVPRKWEPDPALIPEMKSVIMSTIPETEWRGRIEEQEKAGTRLSDVWRTGNAGHYIPFLDQGPIGYCWTHGPVHAVYAMRARMGLSYVPLSAYSVAAPLVNGADRGGWGAWGLERIIKVGIVPQSIWPQGSRNLSLDTVGSRIEAAKYRVAGSWMDLANPVYDRDLTFPQVATLLLNGFPVVCDFMWWGHCVVALDLVYVNGRYGVRIMNSWANWGDKGMAVLTGGKEIPDNAVAPQSLAPVS